MRKPLDKIYANITRLIVLPIILISDSISCEAQNAALESTIKQQMILYHLPGLAACTISYGKISWSGYYGFQNVEQKKLVKKQTLFMLASTSKTITAAALMLLYGEGKFKIDDDVNKYLPFKVTNPSNPSSAITFGQLLRHR